MNKVNELVICRNKYNSQEEFENTIKDAIMLLLNAEYVMTIRYDEKGLGIVVIDYNYSEQEYGDAYPYWLMPEEWESVIWNDEKVWNDEE